MEIKTKRLRALDVASGSNVLMDSNLRTMISLWHKHNDANEVSTVDYANSTGSDNPISAEGIQIDQDLMLVISWGGGFGISRLNNDGSISNLYQDRFPHSSREYMQSIAVDRINKIAYVGGHDSVGLSIYDYSDCIGGADSVVKLGTLTQADGLFGDEFGHSYTSGLSCAGDWVYYGPDDNSAYSVYRMKYNSGAPIFETIPIQNNAGSGNYNRYAAVYYSEDTDRIYLHSYYDGELEVVTGASTASPKAFSILYDDLAGIDNDGYIHMVIEDSINPNHIWCGSGYQTFKIDITNCIVDGVLDGVLPILISDVKQRERDHMTFTNMRFSASTEQKSDYIYVLGDRGWNRQGGWLDQENHNVVSCSKYVDTKDCYRASDYLFIDYAASYRLVTTQNLTKYWVITGYGWDGHRFRVYNENDAAYLYTSGSIEFNSIQLDSLENIGIVSLANSDEYVFTPSGCSLTIEVSNNNGTTWETYAPGTAHTFLSIGNTFKIKISITGNGISSGYILTKEGLSVTLMREYDYQKNIRHTNTKIRGGR